MTAARATGPESRFLGIDLLWRFARDPLAMLMDTARDFPEIAYINVAFQHVYIVTSAEIAHEVLVAQADKFWKGRLHRRMLTGRLLGNGLILSEGEQWQRQRRLMQPTFHARRIEKFAATMVEYTRKRIAGWKPGEIVDVDGEMSKLALEIVCKTLFDVAIHDDGAAHVREAMETIQTAVADSFASAAAPIPHWLPTPQNLKINRAIKTLDGILNRFIAERRESGEDRGDLLSMLIFAQDEDGSRMSNRQVRDEAMTLFIAGHETTAKMLTWAWCLLAQHPEAEAKLHAEVDAVCGDQAPTLAALRKLEYTEMVVKETLRLYPTAWLIARQTLEPVTLGGLRLPKGAALFLSPYTVHRDPRYFDAPDEFRPERFAPEAAKPILRQAYIPFSTGPRICIGNSFAQMEAQVILATLAQRCRLRLAPGQRLEVRAAGTLLPRYGMRMEVLARG